MRRYVAGAELQPDGQVRPCGERPETPALRLQRERSSTRMLAEALATGMLNTLARFAQILSFKYDHASVRVEVDRDEAPPRAVRMHYVMLVQTDEPEQRLVSLHERIRRFGAVYNTLAASCPVTGEVIAVPCGEAAPDQRRLGVVSTLSCS